MKEHQPSPFGIFLSIEACSVMLALSGLLCIASPFLLRGGIVGWFSGHEPPEIDRSNPFLPLLLLVQLVELTIQSLMSVGLGVLILLFSVTTSTGTGVAASLLGILRTRPRAAAPNPTSSGPAQPESVFPREYNPTDHDQADQNGRTCRPDGASES